MVGQVVITILFQHCDGYTTHFYVLWEVDSESDIEYFEFEKITARAISIFLKVQWEPNNQNWRILRKKGLCRLQMTRVFQIWLRNLNLTTFDPPFRLKNGRKRGNPVFERFLPKGGKIFNIQIFNLNFQARFEILSSFVTYLTPFFLKFSNFDFWVPIVISKKKSNGPCGKSFFEFEIFDVTFGINVPKDIEMGGVAIALPKIMVITTRSTIS